MSAAHEMPTVSLKGRVTIPAIVGRAFGVRTGGKPSLRATSTTMYHSLIKTWVVMRVEMHSFAGAVKDEDVVPSTMEVASCRSVRAGGLVSKVRIGARPSDYSIRLVGLPFSSLAYKISASFPSLQSK